MRLFSRRAGLALAAIASVTLGFLAPTTAAHATTKGTVDFSKNVDGNDVQLEGRDGKTVTLLIGLKLSDGTNLQTYCIDLDTNAKNKAAMIEDDWKNYPNPDTHFKAQPEKVNWILHNSYPNVADLSVLGGKISFPALNKKQAIAGTQAAIWHYSNGANLKASQNDAGVSALYKYLTDDKINTGLTSQPADTLTISPEAVEGKGGEKVGPFKVATTADQIALALTNASKDAKLVNADGTEIKTAKNGDEIFVQAPQGDAGKATITGSATAKVLTGRLFRGDGVKTQTLIVATNTNAKVETTAKASWTKYVPPMETPSPTPTPTPTVAPSTPAPTTSAAPAPTKGGGLPVTGSTVTTVIIAGVALLVAGAVIMVMARRRRGNANPA